MAIEANTARNGAKKNEKPKRKTKQKLHIPD